MKVLVATSDVPFVEGGHRVIARALVRALQEAGHSAELITTPQNRFGRQFSAYLATRLTDVTFTGVQEKVDRLISLRFPSYALKHPHHVCWLNHRMREYYDLWPQWTFSLSWKGKMKERMRRRMIHFADTCFLKHNVRKIFAQSKNIQEGLIKWGNIPSEVLYPPPPLEGYFTDGYGDFILSPARLTPLKRVSLLVEALALTKTGKAVLVGEGTETSKIHEIIQRYSLQDRVALAGHVTEAKLLDLYARCRAVYYAPVSEDFGLVTLEAFRSRKPVLTAHDSGGPTELVIDGVNGFVVVPDPKGLADRITTLFEDNASAEKMGAAGYEESMKLNWPETVSCLLH